jgi:hypothetical protein
MDKLKLTGENLGQVFNSRYVFAYVAHATVLRTKAAKLKVENSAQTTFRFFPARFHAPHYTVRPVKNRLWRER